MDVHIERDAGRTARRGDEMRMEARGQPPLPGARGQPAIPQLGETHDVRAIGEVRGAVRDLAPHQLVDGRDRLDHRDIRPGHAATVDVPAAQHGNHRVGETADGIGGGQQIRLQAQHDGTIGPGRPLSIAQPVVLQVPGAEHHPRVITGTGHSGCGIGGGVPFRRTHRGAGDGRRRLIPHVDDVETGPDAGHRLVVKSRRRQTHPRGRQPHRRPASPLPPRLLRHRRRRGHHHGLVRPDVVDPPAAQRMNGRRAPQQAEPRLQARGDVIEHRPVDGRRLRPARDLHPMAIPLGNPVAGGLGETEQRVRDGQPRMQVRVQHRGETRVRAIEHHA